MSNNTPIHYTFADKYPTKSLDGLSVAVIHEDFKLENLEHLSETRNRFRAMFATPFISDFIKYVNTHGSNTIDNTSCAPQVFIDTNVQNQTISATAIFNLGTPEKPLQGDDVALIRLQKSQDFLGLHGSSGQKLTSEQLVEFMEDWEQHITALDEDGNSLPFKMATLGLRNLKAKSTNEVNVAQSTLRAEKSEIEVAELSANVGTIPTQFKFNSTVFDGLMSQDIKVRLKLEWYKSDDKQHPRFVMSIANMGKAMQTASNLFSDQLHNALPAADVYIGNLSVVK